jgi:hypothetical protein
VLLTRHRRGLCRPQESLVRSQYVTKGLVTVRMLMYSGLLRKPRK